MNIIQDRLPPALPDNTFVAMDTEWFGMEDGRMHRPITGKFACLTVSHKEDETYLIQDESAVKETLKILNNCVWIFHNAKFDLTHLRRLAPIPERSKVIDTMMMDRILWNGLYDSFSEADLARRYLHIYLDKSMQKKFKTMTEMTPESIQYAASDSDVLLKIWNEQKKHITKTDMKIYKEIDLPTMWAVMDFRGFGLDVEGWKSLAEDNRQHSKELEEKLDFNPRSSVQVVEKLSSRGFKGMKNSAVDELDRLIAKYPDTEAAKQAEIVLECREFSGFASKYGKRWLEDYLETFDDGSQGFIADYFVTGAKTGRMSASNPALHQIPSRSTKVFRKKFIARPGCKLAILDYSQQEVVIMAYKSQDKKLMQVCNSGDDVYIMAAKLMYNKDITKSDPFRKPMKSVVLGLDYGMSEYGLAKKEKISVAEAAEMIYTFRKTFPGVSEYIDEMEKQKTIVYTVLGRKFWLNPYSNQCPRNALNSPIQGTAADIVKLSVSELHRNWRWDCEFGIVNVIHDEIVLDAPERFIVDIKDFAKETMVNVANRVCPGMRFRVDAFIGDTWADKE